MVHYLRVHQSEHVTILLPEICAYVNIPYYQAKVKTTHFNQNPTKYNDVQTLHELTHPNSHSDMQEVGAVTTSDSMR